MSRERERLLEENRKLRLEKASLENLRRVETIAIRDLGLRRPPAPECVVIVVERAPRCRGRAGGHGARRALDGGLAAPAERN